MGRAKCIFMSAVAALVLTTAVFLPTQANAVTAKTARFVAGFEGFFPCVYADPAGHATIGYGHLIHYGPPTKKDRKKWGCLTKKRALKLLRKDLRTTEVQVMARIRGARVTPSMLTALTSFAFNLGAGALDRNKHLGSGRITNISGKIRKGRYRQAGKQMLLYNGAIIGGKRKVLPGLVTRRRKEYRLLIRDVGRLNQTCSRNCGNGNGNGNGNAGGAGNGGITVG